MAVAHFPTNAVFAHPILQIRTTSRQTFWQTRVKGQQRHTCKCPQPKPQFRGEFRGELAPSPSAQSEAFLLRLGPPHTPPPHPLPKLRRGEKWRQRLVELQGKKEEEGRNQRRREESFYFGERKTRVFWSVFSRFFLFLVGYFRSGKALFYPHPPLLGDTVAPAEAKKCDATLQRLSLFPTWS